MWWYCVSAHLKLWLNSCVWTTFLPWPLIWRPVGCAVGMQGKDNLWKRLSSTRILRPNLSKRSEHVWPVWAQQDYTKPKPSGDFFFFFFSFIFNISVFSTLLLCLSKPLYEKCLIPNSHVVFLLVFKYWSVAVRFGWLVLYQKKICPALLSGINNWPQ